MYDASPFGVDWAQNIAVVIIDYIPRSSHGSDDVDSWGMLRPASFDLNNLDVNLLSKDQ